MNRTTTLAEVVIYTALLVGLAIFAVAIVAVGPGLPL